jgi:predicted MFS family arabinose efflux permease
LASRRDVALLFGALGAFFLSVSMLLPTVPLYVRDLGGDPIQVGLVVGAFSVGVLLARPFVGRAVDTRGRRPLLVAGSLLAAAMAPLHLLTAFGLLVVVRILHGAGLSAFTSATTTLAADYAPRERRTEMLGWLSVSSILAFAIGPVIGLEIANRLGWPALFAAVAVAALASAGCGALLPPPPRERPSGPPIDYRAAIVRRQVLAPTVTNLLVTAAHGAAFTFVPIFFEERLAFNFGLFFLVYAGASLFVRLLAGRLSRQVGDGPMVWGGLVVYALGLACLPFVHGAGSMALSAILLGLGFGTYQPAIYGLIANASTDRSRGMVFSVFLGAFDAGMSLGGLAGGLVVALFGIPALLGGATVVPLLGAAIFVGWLGWRPAPDAECDVALAEVA